MIIKLMPVHGHNEMSISVDGDTIIINGEAFDFSPVPDGATLPREAVNCDWLVSDVERISGSITLTLILPHGANAPHETLFPEPIDASDGPVTLPPYDAIQAPTQEEDV